MGTTERTAAQVVDDILQVDRPADLLGDVEQQPVKRRTLT
jgi:hypothetical protein